MGPKGEESVMPIMIYHLLREAQERRQGRPVTRAQVEAHAHKVLPMVEGNVQGGLERLAGAGLVARLTVDKYTEEEREVWSALGNEPPEVLAVRHPHLYGESFWYFLVSQKTAGRPLPTQEAIRILREVAGDSAKPLEAPELLRRLDARAA
jgi:hypothetical protein